LVELLFLCPSDDMGVNFLAHPARNAYARFLVFSACTGLIGKVSNGSL
jgi:hypothetical protein